MDDPVVSSGSNPGVPTFDQALGNAIRQDRDHRNVSLEDVGTGIMTVERLEEIESGASPVTAGELVFIAGRLGTNFNYFINVARIATQPPVPLRVLKEPVKSSLPAQLQSSRASHLVVTGLSQKQLIVLELLSRGWNFGQVGIFFGHNEKRGGTIRVMADTIIRRLRLSGFDDYRHDMLKPLQEAARRIKQSGSPLSLALVEVAKIIGEPTPVELWEGTGVEDEVAGRISDLVSALGLVTKDLVISPLTYSRVYGAMRGFGSLDKGESAALADKLGFSWNEILNNGPQVASVVREYHDRKQAAREEREAEFEARRERRQRRVYRNLDNEPIRLEVLGDTITQKRRVSGQLATSSRPIENRVVITKEVGERVKQLRLANGWSQWDLVYQHLPFSSGWVSAIEHGQARILPIDLEALAYRFGISSQELLNGGPTVDRIIAEWREREQKELEARNEEARQQREAEEREREERRRSKERLEAQETVSVDQETARRIRRLRQAKKIPARALADVTSHKPPWASSPEGVLHTVPYGFARGYRRDDIQKIANLLGVQLSALLDQDGSDFYSLLREFEDKPKQQPREQAEVSQKPARVVASHPVVEHQLGSFSKSREVTNEDSDDEEEDESSPTAIYVTQTIVPRDVASLGMGLRSVVAAIPQANYGPPDRAAWIMRYRELREAVQRSFDQVVGGRQLTKNLVYNVEFLRELIDELPSAFSFNDDFEQAMKQLQVDRVAIQQQLQLVLSLIKKEGNGGR